jgi:hypothetical protein
MQLDGVGHSVMIRKIVECDDDGDCSENVIHSGGGHGMVRIEKLGSGVGETEVIVLGQGGNWVGDDIGGNLMFISSDDKVALRCPEGDTTMRVDRKEVDAVYLCPKHSQPLEKVERTHHGPHMIQVIETKDDASEY